MNTESRTVLKFLFCVFLGVDTANHLSSLYLRSQGMRQMWVSEPKEVPNNLWPRQYHDLIQKDLEWTESGPLLQFERQRKPQWRCPVHGDFKHTINVILEVGGESHHYCPRCILELLDKLVPQVEPIPQPEELPQ